jgi:hypothetical protein
MIKEDDEDGVNVVLKSSPININDIIASITKDKFKTKPQFDEEYQPDPDAEGSPLTEEEKAEYAVKYHEYREAIAGLGYLEGRHESL